MQNAGLAYREALEAVRAGNVFTTHPPVPAGIDLFPPPMIEDYLGDYARELGVSAQDLLALGRQNPHDANESLSMAVLAIRLSSRRSYNFV